MATTSPHVVRIEDVGKHVRQVVDAMNSEFWTMNRRGYFIEMPEEIAFDMIALVEFEALESTSKQVAITSEIQGGYSTEIQKSSGVETQKSDETRKTDDRNSHVNKGKTTTISEEPLPS